MKEGVKIGKGALSEVLDEALEPDRVKPLRATVEAVEGVEGIAAIRARRMGPFIIIELAVEVDELMSVSAAHDVAVSVSQSLRSEHEEVAEAFVSTEPQGSRKAAQRAAQREREVALALGTQTPPAVKPRVAVENAIRDIIASEKFAAKLKLSRLTLHRLPTFDHLAWVAVIDVTFLDTDFSNAPGHAHALHFRWQKRWQSQGWHLHVRDLGNGGHGPWGSGGVGLGHPAWGLLSRPSSLQST